MPSSKNGGNIKFGVDFEANQASLNKLKKSLQDLQKIKLGDFKGSKEELQRIQKEALQVEKALNRAFNPTLKTTNISAFKTELEKSGITIKQLSTDMASLGPAGVKAFGLMSTEILTTNLQLKETNSLIDSMGKTMINTVKWGIASSVMNTFTQSVQGAFQYVQSLEKSLTNIRIVTGDSTEKMAQFAEQANRSAQALGRSTLDYSKASLTFYQQGLNDEDVQARTEATLKAQNITGAGSQMADYLTSVWNGYKVANEEAELYVDKLAAVADSSASDMSQLAIAMSKVASTASTMGVDVDQLNAQIATVVATTRQAPESVGTAFKTIYTRMNDIKTGSDEAEISLGRYSGTMAELGFNVLDATGHLRDTGQVMEEIGGRWQDLTKEQQIYLAQTMGGQRQVNQLMALFDNWTTYSDLLNTSLESEGTLAEKNARYMESLGAKMEQLGAAGERVKAALIDENEIKGVVDILAQATNLLGIFIEGLGGGSNALLTFGSIATSVFSDSIAKEINNIIINFQNADDRLKKLQQQKANTQKWVSEISPQLSSEAQSKVVGDILKDKQEIESLYKVMSNQEINTYNALLKEKAEHNIIKTELEEKKKISDDILNGIQKQTRELQNQGQLSEKGKNFLENFGNPDELQASLGELKSKVEETFQTISSMKIDLNAPIEESIAQFRKPLDQFLNSQGQMGEILKNSTGYAQLQIQLSQTGITALDAKKAIEGFLNSTADGIGNLDTQKYRELTTEIDKQAAKYREVENARREYVQGIKQLSQVKVFVQMAAGIGQVASGVRTLLNLQKTWKDDSISTGEKIIQTLTSGTMALAQLYTGFQKAAEGATLLTTKWLTAAEGGTLATFSGIVAQDGLTAAFIRTGQAAWESLGPYLPLALAVAAAVGLIVAAYKEWNREADAAKKANEIAADAKKTYDDLKTSLDNVKTALNDLHSAEDNLNDLTKGTQEWRDALQQCNDKVLELISNYPELAQYVTNQNGQLKLNAEGEQAYLDKMQEGVQNARNASYIASSNSREADVTATAADIGHNSIYSYDSQGGATYASANQVLKVTQAIDKVVGEGTSLKDGLSGLTEKISAQTGISEEIVSTILQNEDAVLQLKAQLEQNETTDKLMYETMAQGALANNTTFKGMDQLGQQVASAIGGADLKEATEKAYNQWIDRMSGARMDRFDSASDVSDILEALNKAQGTNWRMDSNAVRGGEANRTLAFVEQDGKTLHEFTRQQIASTIAVKEALEKLGASAENTSNILSAINKSNVSEGAKTGVQQFLAGNDINLKESELESLNGETLQNIFGENIIQVAKDAGYESAEAFKQAFEENVNYAKEEFASIGENTFGPVKQQLKKSLSDGDYLLNTQKNLEDIFTNTFRQSGTEAMTAFQGLKDSLIQSTKMTEQQKEAILSLFANADLSTPKGLNDLEESLRQIGAQTILANENWIKFKGEIQDSQFVNPIDTIFDQQASIDNITGNLKKGEVISEEDLQTLAALDSGVRDLFKRTAQGYELIGNKGSLLKLLAGSNPDYLEAANNLDSLKQKAEEISSIISRDINVEKLKGGDLQGYSSAIMNKINGDEETYAALGVNEDFIEAIKSRLDELMSTPISERNEEWDQEYEKVTADLTEFITKAQTLPEIINQSTESLRSAAALNAQTLSELVSMFQHNEINGQQFGAALQTVSKREMEDLGFDPEVYENYVDLLQATNEEYAENEYLARQVANANMRISQGTQDLIDNWKDWNEVFQDYLASDRDVEVLAEKWGQLKDTLANLFDMDAESFDLLGPDFVADNLDKIEAVKDGIPGAYEGLESLIEENLWGQLENSIQNHKEANDIDLGQAVTIDYDSVLASSQGLFDQLQAISDDANIEVGAEITGLDQSYDDLVTGLNNMIDASGMASDQMAAIFSAMGYDVEFQEKPDAVHENSEDTAYYKPPTYKMDYGQGTLLTSGEPVTYGWPVLESGGSYETITGKKESYQPGTYAIKTITKNGKGNGGKISRKTANAPSNKKGNGGGKGKKGGGGGKGSQPKQPSKAKGVTKEADRYHDNTIRANKLAKNLDKLNKQQERLSGKDSLDNLKKQLDLIEKQKENIQERINLEKNQQIELQNSLTLYGAQFNKDGTIKNYKKTFDAIIKTYNDAVAKWNKMSADEQEKNKDFLENQKQQMDKALSNLDRYDKVLDELADYRQSLIDKAQEQIDIKVKEFDIKVQAKLDFAEARRDWNKFKKEIQYDVRDDDFLGQNNWAFKDLTSYYNNEGTGTVQFFSKQLQDLVTERERLFSQTYYDEHGQAQTVTDRAAFLEKLKETSENLKEQMQGWRQTVNQIKESIFDAIDAAQDAFDQQMKEYEFIGDIVNHNMKVTQMLYGDKAYAQMDKFYDRIEKNNNQQLSFLTQQKDMWYGRMMEQEARMNQLARTNGTNSSVYKEAQDRFEEYKKHWMDSIKDLNSTVEDALDNILDKYNNNIDKALQSLELKMGNGRAFEDIQDEWDAINEKTDTFLDKINSAYEIDKLQNAFQDAIKQNDGDIAAQKSLNGLMEQQLAYLKDKEKLTQYDVDRANTLLQIEMKRLALEQTRANKNRLRLRRDSQGNYTYQYTADQEAVDKSKQELADLQNSLYNSDKAAYVDNLNAIKKSADNIKQQLEDIWKDENLSKEEKLQKSYELEERYGTLINDLLGENASIRNNLIQSSFDELVKLYGYSEEQLNAMSNEEKNRLMRDLVPQAGSLLSGSVQAMIAQGGIGDYMTQAIGRFLEAQDQKITDMTKLEESAQINFEDIINDQTTVLQQAEKLLDNNEKLIKSYDDEIAKIQGTINEVNKMDKAYKQFFETVQKGEKYSPMDAITRAFQIEQRADIETNGGTWKDVKEQYYEGKEGYTNSINSPENSYNDLVNYKPYQSQWSEPSAAAMFGSTSVPQNYLNNKNGSYSDLLNQNANTSTLNRIPSSSAPIVTADFTKPLTISGTSILENLVKTTNSKLVTISEYLDSMLKQDSNYQAKMLSTTETIKNLINQSISIAADFPNAKDVKTIIDAIESLSNIAAQKATTIDRI